MKHFTNILFVVDYKQKDSASFERAVELAIANNAQLTVITILEELPDMHGNDIQGVSMLEIRRLIINENQSELDRFVASIDSPLKITCKVLTGVAFMAIIQEVLTQNIDLVIKEPEKEDYIDHLFTSSDMHLMRKCPCPVWINKPSHKKHYKNIMLAVDIPDVEISDNNSINQRLIDIATSLALSEHAELHLTHIWQAYGESTLRSGLGYQPKAFVDAYVEKTHSEHQLFLETIKKNITAPIEPILHLTKGQAKEVIPKLVKQQQIDLLIMGTVGRSGLPGFFMGNTSETILNQINCSVLTTKPAEFITPITLI